VRGAAASGARPSNWRSRSACLPCYCPAAQQVTGSRAVAIRQRRAQAKSMLIPRATPSTLSWGAGARVPSHCSEIGHRGGRPRFFSPPHGLLVLPLMSSLGLSTPVAPCGDVPRLLSSMERGGIGTLPHAPPRRSRGLATMDGSPSLRRRHRAAVRSSWAGFLHTRPLVYPLCTEPLSIAETSQLTNHSFCGMVPQQ
jgi:hypothetical protein